MKEQVYADDARFDALLDSFNKAYSNGQLDNYRALELKDSFAERTTCRVQWGPANRA